MKKKTILFFVSILAIMISMAIVSPAKASITGITWLPPYYASTGTTIIYKDGASVKVAIRVMNDIPVKMNVSKVIINFPVMGKNKTLDLSASPSRIRPGSVELFTISFNASATEAISSSILHDYNIIIEHVDAANRIVGVQIFRRADIPGAPSFVVYSTTQADAADLYAKLITYSTVYTAFTSAEAKSLASQALTTTALGLAYYTQGEYSKAKTQYETAVSLYGQAVTAEKDYTTDAQEATLNTTLTTNAAALIEANARMKTAEASKLLADAAMTNAYGFYFIGIGFAVGWSFMGIGVIIYALRKPKTAG